MRHIAILILLAVSLISIGCQREPRPQRVYVEQRPVLTPEDRGYNWPARAIQPTRWVVDATSTNPPTGPIAVGDYVLMRRDPDEPMPAWIDAIYPQQGYVQVQPEHFRTEHYTHEVVRETAWYAQPVTGARPSGTIVPRTRVVIVRDVDGYHEVVTSTGVRGYVLTQDVGKL